MKWKFERLKNMSEKELKNQVTLDFYLCLFILGSMMFLSIVDLVKHYVFGNAFLLAENGLGFFAMCFGLVAIFLTDICFNYVELRLRELKQ